MWLIKSSNEDIIRHTVCQSLIPGLSFTVVISQNLCDGHEIDQWSISWKFVIIRKINKNLIINNDYQLKKREKMFVNKIKCQILQLLIFQFRKVFFNNIFFFFFLIIIRYCGIIIFCNNITVFLHTVLNCENYFKMFLYLKFINILKIFDLKRIRKIRFDKLQKLHKFSTLESVYIRIWTIRI